MSIVLKIVSNVVKSERINGKNGSFESRQQEAWLDLPSGERRVVRVRLGRENGGYSPGEYTVGPGSFFVGQYGDLQLGTLDLVPVSVAKPAASVVR